MVLWDWDRDLFGRDAWRELARMRSRMNRLLGDITGTVLGTPFPPVNVSSDTEKVVVTAEVPGVKAEDLDLSVENDVLSISGSREPEKVADDEAYRRHERGHGAFARGVRLPYAVNPERIDASYADGVLTVTLPRSEASKPRKIEIK